MGEIEPVAIIGTGCRFPGDICSPSQFWELLQNPHDVASKPPADRFNMDAFYKGGRACHGTTNAKRGYFIQGDMRAFDAPFFHISPAEAATMDPQQRLLLETVYEALERAGLRIDSLQGSSVGVYCGQMNHDYPDLLRNDPDRVPNLMETGISRAILANRVSYFFDWRGPSMTIDTACSSSLVAVHLAVEALQQTMDCSLAVAAGSSLMLSPDRFQMQSQMKMLSPTGYSSMWDAESDGFVRGEGVAAVVLKRLRDAIKDGDHIECIIRASGVNNDGHSIGLTVPSGDAQLNLIRATYSRAGLDPLRSTQRCQYFEAHGTGTPVGDPQEASAIRRAFFPEGQTSDEGGDFLYVGSNKTVIGHTEGAAGLAGLIKASLALQHGIIPPNLRFNRVHDNVAPYTAHLRVPTQALPWPDVPLGIPRRASINSFGFGGTNAHIILERFVPSDPEVDSAPSNQPIPLIVLPFVFSARSEERLDEVLHRHLAFLEHNPATDLVHLAGSLMMRRSAFSYRLIITADSSDSLLKKVRDELKRRRSGSRSTIVHRLAPGPKRVLGVFTGQGSQWPQMGLELVTTVPQVACWLKELQHSLNTLPARYRPDFSIVDELSASETSSRIHTPVISQTVTTALQILQVNLLKALGINFAAVVGHSSGEIAAVFAAGWITASDAIKIAYLRGVAATHAGHEDEEGRMMAVEISLAEALAVCAKAPYTGSVVVAASNSPSSVTLSGDRTILEELQWLFESLDRRPQMLKVKTAYHSHHMIPCARHYTQSLQICGIKRPVYPVATSETKWFSSVYGNQMIDTLQIEYWEQNMLRPVLFSETVIAGLGALGDLDAVIEIGPNPTLQGPTLQSLSVTKLENMELPYISVSRRKCCPMKVLAEAIGSLWVYLGPENFDIASYIRLFLPSSQEFVFIKDLPTYPFDHSTPYWDVPRLAAARLHRSHPRHPLLGAISAESGQKEWRWRNHLRLCDVEWLEHHRIESRPIFPVTGYLLMALEAAQIIADGHSLRLIDLHNVRMDRTIAIPDDAVGIETLFAVNLSENDTDGTSGTFTCQANFDGNLECCASGCIQIALGDQDTLLLPAHESQVPRMYPVEKDHFYHTLSQLGYCYTGPFSALEHLKRCKDIAYGRISCLPGFVSEMPMLLHPAILDVGLQALLLAISSPGDGQLTGVYAPIGISRITINPAFYQVEPTGMNNDQAQVEATITAMRSGAIEGDIELFDGSGRGIVQAEHIRLAPLNPSIDSNCSLFSTIVWGPLEPVASSLDSLDAASLKASRLLQERLSLLYLRDAQRELSTADCHKFDPHRKRYKLWMDRVLSHVREGLHPFLGLQDLDGDIKSIIPSQQNPSEIPEFEVLHVAGQSLYPWFRGQTTIMEELRRDDLLTRFYTQSHSYTLMSRQLADLVAQMAYRYPRMRILEVGAGTGSATRLIIERIAGSYHSYMYTDISSAFFEDARKVFRDAQPQLQYQVLDLEQDPTLQGFSENWYDLIVSSNVLHATRRLKQTMTNIRRLLRPGGRAVVFEHTDPESIATTLPFGGFEGWWLGEHDGRPWSPLISVSQWDQLLQSTGFGGIETVTPVEERNLLGASVFTTQMMDERIKLLNFPLSVPASKQYKDLVVFGGTSAPASSLVPPVCELLKPYFDRVIVNRTVETFLRSDITTTSVALVLADIDSSCLERLTEDRWQVLKHLVKTTGKLLWVGTGTEPLPCLQMSKGILRSLVHKYPHALVQHLTTTSPASIDAKIVATCLMRLAHMDGTEGDRLPDYINALEPELLLEDGVLKIPRFQRCDHMNRRLQASRGYATQIVDPHNTCVELRVSDDDCNKLALFTSPQQLMPSYGGIIQEQEHRLVQIHVHYATRPAVRVATVGYLYVIIGHQRDTDERVIALSQTNASVICTPSMWTQTLPCWISPDKEPSYLKHVAASLVVEYLARQATPASAILVHEPQSVAESFQDLLLSRGLSVQFSTTCLPSASQESGFPILYIPPRYPTRALRRQVPRNVSIMATFAPDSDSTVVQLKSILHDVLHHGITTFYQLTSSVKIPVSEHETVAEILRQTCLSRENCKTLPSEVDVIDPGELVASTSQIGQVDVVDWICARQLPSNILPASSLVTLLADKTYFLVNITMELAQSICQWLISRGARYIVVSGAMPSVDAKWIAAMAVLGAKVVMIPMDVFNDHSVLLVDNHIRQQLPRVGGVVCGAMSAHDIASKDMAFEEVQKTIAPIICGSQILDELYRGLDLQFFIFMGSINGPIGNFNQTVQAAATEFMTGLVYQRQRCSEAGSIIHTATIRGVSGMELNEHDSLAETMGICHISERDFHELIAEGILAGRPGSSECPSILSGLRLGDPITQPNVIWYRDPRMWAFIKDFHGTNNSTPNVDENNLPPKTQLASAGSHSEAVEVMANVFRDKLHQKLQLPKNATIAGSSLLNELGIDSLVAVDLRIWFAKELDINMPIFQLLGGFTLDALARSAVDMFNDAQST